MNAAGADFAEVDQRIPHHDPRLACFAPQVAERDAPALRLERFPHAAQAQLAGHIGPLANLRTSSGCALLLRTDSPQLVVELERLRHHQPVPCGLALEVEHAQGWQAVHSGDLREHEGDLAVGFNTGLERGGEPRLIALWLPLISTCALRALSLTRGARLEQAAAPRPRWLAIGDSLTQGFSVQSPLQNWVHRLSRRWQLPVWNLGVGGILIEPQVFAWALGAQRFDLVTIALGSNHSWKDQDCARAGDLAVELAQIALDGNGAGTAHGRIVWLLPPWKPCEEGKGPRDFAGVPLDQAAGRRAGLVRSALAQRLGALGPRLELVSDLMPHDLRLLPDGLHPTAHGSARFADNLHQALHGGR
jgi:lysophospholipase L1-like esterase